MSEISKSYPYLSIARKHGLDYGDVLKTAVAVRDLEPLPFPYTPLVIDDIVSAVNYFEGVQSGAIAFPTT